MLQFVAVISLALFGLASCQTDEIKHVSQGSNQFVSTSPTNFGVRSNLLSTMNWKTFSQNGDEAVIFEEGNCSPKRVELGAKNIEEVARAKNELLNLQQTSISTTYSLQGNSISSNSFGSTGMSIFDFESLAITRYSDDNFSVRQPNMVNNLARVIVVDDVVTFVYSNGKVEMKPIDCLEADEKQFVETIKMKVKQGEEELQERLRQQQQEQQQQQQLQQQQQMEMYQRQMQQQREQQQQQMQWQKQQQLRQQQQMEMYQRQMEQQRQQQMEQRQLQQQMRFREPQMDMQFSQPQEQSNERQRSYELHNQRLRRQMEMQQRLREQQQRQW